MAIGRNIGDAAVASGVSAKMIRYYESLGLIPKVSRTASNYRRYSDSEIHQLRFIRHARQLGFSIPQISDLLGLWRNAHRNSRKVRTLAEAHLQDLDEKIAVLQAMRNSLTHLVTHCHGDDRPDCPILEGLAKDDLQPANNTSTPLSAMSGKSRNSAGG